MKDLYIYEEIDSASTSIMKESINHKDGVFIINENMFSKIPSNRSTTFKRKGSINGIHRRCVYAVNIRRMKYDYEEKGFREVFCWESSYGLGAGYRSIHIFSNESESFINYIDDSKEKSEEYAFWIDKDIFKDIVKNIKPAEKWVEQYKGSNNADLCSWKIESLIDGAVINSGGYGDKPKDYDYLIDNLVVYVSDQIKMLLQLKHRSNISKALFVSSILFVCLIIALWKYYGGGIRHVIPSEDDKEDNIIADAGIESLDGEETGVIKEKDEIIKKYQPYFQESIEYHTSQYMIKDEDIEEIIKKRNVTSRFSYSFDGDIDKIIESIEMNSAKAQDEWMLSAFNCEYADVFESCLRQVLNKISIDNNNLDSDFHVIKDMKILTYKDTDYACDTCEYLYVDNTININFDGINKLVDKYDVGLSEVLKIFLEFEISKVRKHTHPDDIENSLAYKSTTDSLIYDGTAEIEMYVKNAMNSDLAEEFFRTEEAEAMGELLLLGITNKGNNTLEKYFSAINDNNAPALWSVLNLKDEDDIRHYYKILYSYDATLFRNPMYNYFMNSNQNESFVEFLGLEYKLDLYMRSVNNLFEYQKRNQIGLKENLVLYSIILNAIMNDGRVSDDLVYFDYFFCGKIEELNNIYMEYLREYYDVEQNKIDELISNDVRFIMIDMGSIMHNDNDYLEEYLTEAAAFMGEYPMIKAIAASDYIYTTGYKKVMNILDGENDTL